MASRKNNTAFLNFCQEYCQQHQYSADGIKLSSKAATRQAERMWNKMDEQQRKKYQKKAPTSTAPATARKYTTLGVPINFITNAEEEIKQYEIKMFKDITNTVNTMAAGDSLEDFNVCIFHFYTFCYAKIQKRHYPAELAIAKFSLREGVLDVYHAICNPGPLPLGYAAEIQAKSLETHHLPVPDPSKPSNLENIFYELISFVDDRSNRSKPPPLYVLPDNLAEAKQFISTLCVDYGMDPYFIDVYSLPHLLFELKNAAAKTIVFQSVAPALLEFERDVYEYASGISCSVHKELGSINKCSRSIVTRSAYIICDNCCQDLNIERIPGKHFPTTTTVVSDQASCSHD